MLSIFFLIWCRSLYNLHDLVRGVCSLMPIDNCVRRVTGASKRPISIPVRYLPAVIPWRLNLITIRGHLKKEMMREHGNCCKWVERREERIDWVGQAKSRLVWSDNANIEDNLLKDVGVENLRRKKTASMPVSATRAIVYEQRKTTSGNLVVKWRGTKLNVFGF